MATGRSRARKQYKKEEEEEEEKEEEKEEVYKLVCFENFTIHKREKEECH